MGDNGDLRGFKTSVWEGGHRVPAIARFPGKIEKGTETGVTVLSMDVLPTVLSVAGISTERAFDGRDFSPVMFSQNKLKERPVFWRYRNQWAVRKGDWKYVKRGDDEFLFNLDLDLSESKNLLNENQGKAKALKADLADWEKEMNKTPQQTN